MSDDANHNEQVQQTRLFCVKWLGDVAKAYSTDEFNKLVWTWEYRRGAHWQPLVQAHGRFDCKYFLNCLQITVGEMFIATGTASDGNNQLNFQIKKVIEAFRLTLAVL